MQCQTTNMMQLEANITFTYWLQVACGEKITAENTLFCSRNCSAVGLYT